MGRSKRRVEKTRSLHHLNTLHQRLRDALSLCTRYNDGNRRKWECKDIETRKHVLRSIAAFLDCVSRDMLSNPLVKDSVADIIGALVGILDQNDAVTAGIAADAVVELDNVLTSSILQPFVPDLVHPLSSLSVSKKLQIAISSARALNLLLSNLNKKQENEVWKILDREDIVPHIVTNILDFSCSTSFSVYIQEMLALLAIILWWWPQTRYSVWSNERVMGMLEVLCTQPDTSVGVALMKFCSSLALCGLGAKKILENGKTIVGAMIQFMGNSYPLSVRIESFKLAQCLMLNEQGCSRVMSMSCEPIVKSIVCAISEWKWQEGKSGNDYIPLMIEACRLAMIARWPGKHHLCFWKMRIDRALVDLLLPNFVEKCPSYHNFPLKEQISIVRENLVHSSLLVLRPYVWDILGWLAIGCGENFDRNFSGNEANVDVLVTAACVAFEDVIRRGPQLCHDDVISTFRSESAVRVVQMMMFSHCNYISLKTRTVLSKVLNQNGERHLKQMLYMLKSPSSGANLGMQDLVKIVISLIGLTCCLALPHYRGYIVEGAKIILSFMVGCSYESSIPRSNFALHLNSNLVGKTCCVVHTEGWEGRNIILFLALWGLAVLLHHYGSEDMSPILHFLHTEHVRAQLVSKLLEICNDMSTCGSIHFAAYILTYFGIFGFPSKYGEKIGKVLDHIEYTDVKLLLSNDTAFYVHGVFLKVRCPSLLPSDESPFDEGKSDNPSITYDTNNWCRKFQKDIRLSSQINPLELGKLLEYVYLGHMQAEENAVKRLKALAKCCRLHPLSDLLSRRFPKWGTFFPSFDLTPALRLDGENFSDIILEAKATEMSWICSICSSPIPHMHVHKIILWASCDYIRALLQSGMQESQSQILRVPIGWEALVRLVSWFYSFQLPKPPSGCLWSSMGAEEKLRQLEPYVELSWLAEFWLLEELKEECSRIVDHGLDSAGHLSVKILQMAANLSQWKVVEGAANHAAPYYRQLCESGELEGLDQMLFEMVRSASVRLSQSRP